MAADTLMPTPVSYSVDSKSNYILPDCNYEITLSTVNIDNRLSFSFLEAEHFATYNIPDECENVHDFRSHFRAGNRVLKCDSLLGFNEENSFRTAFFYPLKIEKLSYESFTYYFVYIGLMIGNSNAPTRYGYLIVFCMKNSVLHGVHTFEDLQPYEQYDATSNYLFGCDLNKDGIIELPIYEENNGNTYFSFESFPMKEKKILKLRKAAKLIIKDTFTLFEYKPSSKNNVSQ